MASSSSWPSYIISYHPCAWWYCGGLEKYRKHSGCRKYRSPLRTRSGRNVIKIGGGENIYFWHGAACWRLSCIHRRVAWRASIIAEIIVVRIIRNAAPHRRAIAVIAISYEVAGARNLGLAYRSICPAWRSIILADKRTSSFYESSRRGGSRGITRAFV